MFFQPRHIIHRLRRAADNHVALFGQTQHGKFGNDAADLIQPEGINHFPDRHVNIRRADFLQLRAAVRALN